MNPTIDEGALVELLRALVAVPSVNPGMLPDSADEASAGELVAAWGHDHRFTVQVQNVLGDRKNVLIDLGLAHLPTLALVTHLDTVPYGELSARARAITYEQGRVYGRGACDAKGSLAAMLTALLALREQQDSLKVNVQVAAMVDEEHTFQGVLTYLQQCTETTRPVAAIVGEPTLLEVVIAHKGMLRFRLDTQGRAAHSSTPGQGLNAVEKMADVLQALRAAFAADMPEPHPLVGGPTYVPAQIIGGTAPNVVPDRCTVVIDRRLVPGESAQSALAWFDAQLDRVRALDPDLHITRGAPFVQDDALATPPDAPLVRVALAAHAAVCGPAAPIGVPFGTDGSKLAVRGGIPTIILGPGSIAQAHTADEWIEVAQLGQAARIYSHCALALGQ